MANILDGVRVVDWTEWHAGPYAASMLGDFGADVIHIEQTGRGDAMRGVVVSFGVPQELPGGRNLAFESVNRNKKSLTLDLKRPEGKDILYRLASRADVFITNMKSADKLGFSYEALRARNPRLIYAYGSSVGPRGPEAGIPSLEMVAYARSGAMLACGEEGMPPIYLTPCIADRITGILLAYGIMTALLGRERLGTGQRVDVSQLGSMAFLQGYSLMPVLMLGREFERPSRNDVWNPLYNCYRCSDSKWIALSLVPSDRYWPQLCRRLGIASLEQDIRFAADQSRHENRHELIALLDSIFASKTSDEWQAVLGTGDLLFSKVQTLTEVTTDPQVLANNYVTEWDHPTLGRVKVDGFPFELSETPARFTLPAPEFGEHKEEILLNDLGYCWEEVTRLSEEGII